MYTDDEEIDIFFDASYNRIDIDKAKGKLSNLAGREEAIAGKRRPNDKDNKENTVNTLIKVKAKFNPSDVPPHINSSSSNSNVNNISSNMIKTAIPMPIHHNPPKPASKKLLAKRQSNGNSSISIRNTQDIGKYNIYHCILLLTSIWTFFFSSSYLTIISITILLFLF